MSDLICGNAFHILGLDAGADVRETQKRAREILNRLKIHDVPAYDFDFGFCGRFRTEKSVKDALQRLSSPKNRIRDIFFWFHLQTRTDEAAGACIREKDYAGAITVWLRSYDEKNADHFSTIKNLALLYSLLFIREKNPEYITNSIKLWQKLVKSGDFWNSFAGDYRARDEFDTDQGLLEEFRVHINDHLSDFFTEIMELSGDKQAVLEFQKRFGGTGEKLDKDVLDPIFSRINASIHRIDETRSLDRDIFPEKGVPVIDNELRSLDHELKQIREYGLCETSEIRVLRDRIAEKIREISIFYHNELKLFNEAHRLLLKAEKVCATDSMRVQIRQDIEPVVLSKMYHADKEFIDTVNASVTAGNISRAITLLDEKLADGKLPDQLREYYRKQRADLDAGYQKYGEPIKSAPSLYTINGIGTKIYGDTLYFVVLFLPMLPLSRYAVERVGDQFRFFGKLELHTWQRIWRYLFLAFIGYFIIGPWIFVFLGLWLVFRTYVLNDRRRDPNQGREKRSTAVLGISILALVLLSSAIFFGFTGWCPGEQKSCGNRCYDPAVTSCCNNELWEGAGVTTCGEACYNPATHSCCNGMVMEGRWATCGNECYDTRTYGCCNGRIYELNQYSCCNNGLYGGTSIVPCGSECIDSKRSICCGNQQSCPSSWQCCAGKCMNPDLYYCERRYI